MGNKVNLEYIVDGSSRKATYVRRKKGMLKKLEELTTLCGIDVCAVVYSEFHHQPLVWPSPPEVQRMINNFNNYSEFGKSKNMMNQESFLEEKILKATEKLAKFEKENREMEMSMRMFELMANGNIIDNMNNVELNDMAWIIDEKLKHVNWRITELDNKASTSQSQAQMADEAVKPIDKE
ncbi:agamous-like MADS-box protein AGL80 [Lotus japonicus]|uniref:agamous-like MADS-box protein AGL80 n=1 Tax=Lotus japonicus TaxID=34305 RepID=UPI002586BF96|nr:agamous-like MADS-box protein AGL80 [Lotus japonicus]